MKLRESGCINKFKKFLTQGKEEKEPQGPTIIQFTHVYVLFIILLSGNVASIIICFGENIFFKYQCKKQIQRKRWMDKRRLKKVPKISVAKRQITPYNKSVIFKIFNRSSHKFKNIVIR